MHFRNHKRVVVALLLVESLLALFPELEQPYNLHLIMAGVYFGVSFWFVFGERRWWLYQFAGVAYVGFTILGRILFIFQMPLSRPEYHMILAGFWGLIWLTHLFVERNFGPPMARPPSREHERYFPDDDD